MKLNRRRHRLLLTKNTEYHVHDRECIGVRDRRSGGWDKRHPALRGWLLGGVDRRSTLYPDPMNGTRLVFSVDQRDVLTSPLVGEERPERRAVQSYLYRAETGFIEASA